MQRRTPARPETNIAGHFHGLLDARRAVAAPLVLHRDSSALRDMRRRERIYRRGLVAADAIATSLSLLVAIDLLGGYALRPLYLVVVPLMVLGAKISGLYDKDELVIDHSTLNELPRLLNLATILALLVWIARHFVVIGAPTTRNLLLLWVLMAAALVVGRSVARQVARRLAAGRALPAGGAAQRLRTPRGQVSRLSERAARRGRQARGDRERPRPAGGDRGARQHPPHHRRHRCDECGGDTGYRARRKRDRTAGQSAAEHARRRRQFRRF